MTAVEDLTDEDSARIAEQLDWIYLVRSQNLGRDSVHSARELAFLRIDYGTELIDALCAARDEAL